MIMHEILRKLSVWFIMRIVLNKEDMNIRQTRQKEAILSVVHGEGIHMTAEEIFAAVQEKEPGIGLATVYRNLKSLCDAGIIQKVTAEDMSFYDGCGDPHDHFLCTECGRIEDVPSFESRELNSFLTKQIRGKVHRHVSVYYGICEDCLGERDRKITS